jgi:hypothetical protein
VHQALDPPGRPLVVAALVHGEAGCVEASHDRVEGGDVHGLEADIDGVVRGTGLHDQSLRLVVVAPCQRSGRTGLTGEQPDDLGEEGRQ